MDKISQEYGMPNESIEEDLDETDLEELLEELESGEDEIVE